MIVTDKEVINLIESVLKHTDLNNSDSPETIAAWDSFSQIVIFTEISTKFGVEIESDEILQFFTVSDLIELVNARLE